MRSKNKGSPSRMEVKTYIVMQRQNLVREGEPNREILAVKLTRAAADEVVEQNPGTYVEKHIADK